MQLGDHGDDYNNNNHNDTTLSITATKYYRQERTLNDSQDRQIDIESRERTRYRTTDIGRSTGESHPVSRTSRLELYAGRDPRGTTISPATPSTPVRRIFFEERSPQ